jgi:plasmid maintenance system antidote protein VapI
MTTSELALRQYQARIVRETIEAEGLTVAEAARRFSVRPRRIQRILSGEYQAVESIQEGT